MLLHHSGKNFDFSVALDKFIHDNYLVDNIFRARFVGESMRDSVVYYPSYVKKNDLFTICGVQVYEVDKDLHYTTHQQIVAFDRISSKVLYQEKVDGFDQIDNLHKKVSLVENDLTKTVHTKCIKDDKNKEADNEKVC